MGPKLQPYIHDVRVSIQHAGIWYQFLIFFKRHKKLPVNECIQALGGRDMNGDLMVVACGERANVRNLRGAVENNVADIAVRR